jgi:SAM-dependent methyltransferase
MPGRPVLSLATHDAFGAIEEELNGLLDESLRPRGPGMLYDLVAGLNLSRDSVALDLGCGEGRHTRELSTRFGIRVVGLDPLHRQLAIAADGVEVAGAQATIELGLGVVECLPIATGSVDLVWCRDVLSLVEDLDAAYCEIARVLKDDGRALVYQMFVTDRLGPAEAEWLLPVMGCFAASMRVDRSEAAIRSAGLTIERCEVLGTEWGEHAEESTGKGARMLIHAARLLRDPERYIRRYGNENYDIALGDSLWHVYRLIGKLSGRVYLLRKDDAKPNGR